MSKEAATSKYLFPVCYNYLNTSEYDGKRLRQISQKSGFAINHEKQRVAFSRTTLIPIILYGKRVLFQRQQHVIQCLGGYNEQQIY